MSEMPLSRREQGERAAARIEALTQRVRRDFLLERESNIGEIRRKHAERMAALRAAGATQLQVNEVERAHREELAQVDEMLEERRKRLGHRVSVKGRQTPSGKVWDVFQLDGENVRIHLTSVSDPGEALTVAQDLVLGRVAVSFAGARRCFERAGKLLLPSRKIEKPGEGINVQRVDSDHMVISKR